MKKATIILLLLVCATMVYAQNANVLNSNERHEMIERHNHWRKQVGVAPIEWSNDLAKDAKKWVLQLAKKDCRMKHSNGPHGENIFWASYRSTATGVCDSWASEIKYYKHSSNTCQAGKVCGHYTQIVWSKTTKVGCAVARCRNGNYIWMCMYSPPGNWRGQKPY